MIPIILALVGLASGASANEADEARSRAVRERAALHQQQAQAAAKAIEEYAKELRAYAHGNGLYPHPKTQAINDLAVSQNVEHSRMVGKQNSEISSAVMKVVGRNVAKSALNGNQYQHGTDNDALIEAAKKKGIPITKEMVGTSSKRSSSAGDRASFNPGSSGSSANSNPSGGDTGEKLDGSKLDKEIKFEGKKPKK